MFTDSQYTNHSLHVSTATRLFSAGVDEQLMKQKTHKYTEHHIQNEILQILPRVDNY